MSYMVGVQGAARQTSCCVWGRPCPPLTTPAIASQPPLPPVVPDPPPPVCVPVNAEDPPILGTREDGTLEFVTADGSRIVIPPAGIKVSSGRYTITREPSVLPTYGIESTVASGIQGSRSSDGSELYIDVQPSLTSGGSGASLSFSGGITVPITVDSNCVQGTAIPVCMPVNAVLTATPAGDPLLGTGESQIDLERLRAGIRVNQGRYTITNSAGLEVLYSDDGATGINLTVEEAMVYLDVPEGDAATSLLDGATGASLTLSGTTVPISIDSNCVQGTEIPAVCMPVNAALTETATGQLVLGTADGSQIVIPPAGIQVSSGRYTIMGVASLSVPLTLSSDSGPGITSTVEGDAFYLDVPAGLADGATGVSLALSGTQAPITVDSNCVQGTEIPADAFPNDATETTDADGDGVGDNADAFPIVPSLGCWNPSLQKTLTLTLDESRYLVDGVSVNGRGGFGLAMGTYVLRVPERAAAVRMPSLGGIRIDLSGSLADDPQAVAPVVAPDDRRTYMYQADISQQFLFYGDVVILVTGNFGTASLENPDKPNLGGGADIFRYDASCAAA